MYVETEAASTASALAAFEVVIIYITTIRIITIIIMLLFRWQHSPSKDTLLLLFLVLLQLPHLV